MSHARVLQTGTVELIIWTLLALCLQAFRGLEFATDSYQSACGQVLELVKAQGTVAIHFQARWHSACHCFAQSGIQQPRIAGTHAENNNTEH